MGYAQAIVAVAALGYQIYAGEDQKRRQKLNESRQGEAQKKALAASVAAKRSAGIEQGPVVHPYAAGVLTWLVPSIA